MKTIKVFLLIITILFLIGCEEKQQDIFFDNADFEYIGITNDDYLLYRDGNNDLEIMLDEEDTLTASYERSEDIFIIVGKQDSYIIRKNGVIVVACSGEELTCSGVENVSFSEDIDVLFAAFEDEEISIIKIVLGALIIIGAISLFFVPKYIFQLMRIRNIKIGQLFMLRLIILLVIAIGILIIVLSV